MSGRCQHGLRRPPTFISKPGQDPGSCRNSTPRIPIVFFASLQGCKLGNAVTQAARAMTATTVRHSGPVDIKGGGHTPLTRLFAPPQGCKFGNAFTRAAHSMGATSRHDQFDTSIIEVRIITEEESEAGWP